VSCGAPKAREQVLWTCESGERRELGRTAAAEFLSVAGLIRCDGTFFGSPPSTMGAAPEICYMKLATVLTLGMLTLASSAVGAYADTGALAPGKPAGVRTAQFERGTGMYIVAGAALIGITVALATAGNGVSANGTGASGAGSSSSSSTTTGTSP
jgi:hypothetical protein